MTVVITLNQLKDLDACEAITPLWEAYEEAIAKEFTECYFKQEQNHS